MKINSKNVQFIGANIYLTQDEILLILNALFDTEEEVEKASNIAFEEYKNSNDDADFFLYESERKHLQEIKDLIVNLEKTMQVD